MKTPDGLSIGQRIRKEREARSWSQKTLADKIKTTVGTVNRWENDKNEPQPLWCEKLSEVFGKSLEELGFVRHGSKSQVQEQLVASDEELPIDQEISCLTPLIGREKELDKILSALQNDHHPIVTITGVAGVGKTRLALKVIERLTQDMFPGGYTYLSLVPVTNPHDTPRKIAQTLGLAGEAADARLARNRSTGRNEA